MKKFLQLHRLLHFGVASLLATEFTFILATGYRFLTAHESQYAYGALAYLITGATVFILFVLCLLLYCIALHGKKWAWNTLAILIVLTAVFISYWIFLITGPGKMSEDEILTLFLLPCIALAASVLSMIGFWKTCK